MNVPQRASTFVTGFFGLFLASSAAADHRSDFDRDRDFDRGGRGDRGFHYDHYHDDDHSYRHDDEGSENLPFADTALGRWFYDLSFGWAAGVLTVIGAGLGVIWRGLLLFREVRRPDSTLDSP